MLLGPLFLQHIVLPSQSCLLMEGTHPGCRSHNANTAVRAPAVGGQWAQGVGRREGEVQGEREG